MLIQKEQHIKSSPKELSTSIKEIEIQLADLHELLKYMERAKQYAPIYNEHLNSNKSASFQRQYCSDNGSFHTSNNAKYTGNYTAKSIKRTQLENCIFQNATFDDAAVTGSIFQRCNFSQCSMKKADFEFCNFDNCDFFDNLFEDESFNNSIFYESKFINSPFTSCTLTGVHFKTVFFSHSDMLHCTLESAVFEDCTFKNMDLSQLNMEYIELKNVHMEKVLLPFSQIPSLFCHAISYFQFIIHYFWRF